MNCSICGKPIPDKNGWKYGNNAAPINNGRACDQCDSYLVIPTRLAPRMGAKQAVEMGLAMAQLHHASIEKIKEQFDGIKQDVQKVIAEGKPPKQRVPNILVDNDICGGCGAHFDTEEHDPDCVNWKDLLSDKQREELPEELK